MYCIVGKFHTMKICDYFYLAVFLPKFVFHIILILRFWKESLKIDKIIIFYQFSINQVDFMYFKRTNFCGQKLSRISQILPKSAKVYAAKFFKLGQTRKLMSVKNRSNLEKIWIFITRKKKLWILFWHYFYNNKTSK